MFLPTSDKQREVGLYPDTANKNLFCFYCLLCVSLSGTTSQGDWNAICDLFCEIVPSFFPLSSGGPRSWRCGCLWKLTGNLAQGANADPKRAGQMCAHTPAFCRWLPAEMSNTMMWWEAAGELAARHYRKSWHMHKGTRKDIHTQEYTLHQ